jgi:hypothetical protein
LKEQRNLAAHKSFSESQIAARTVGYQVSTDVLRSHLFQTALEAEMMIVKSTALVRTTALAAIGAALAATAPVLAEDAMPNTSTDGRYIFNNTADGVVRLDTKSGEVALCSQRTMGWACTAAPEDRAVLENEIARLRAENAALKKDILARGLPLPPGASPVPDQPSAQNKTSQNSITVPLPSDADIDRVTDFANRMWHRFKDMVDRAQQQIFNKS